MKCAQCILFETKLITFFLIFIFPFYFVIQIIRQSCITTWQNGGGVNDAMCHAPSQNVRVWAGFYSPNNAKPTSFFWGGLFNVSNNWFVIFVYLISQLIFAPFQLTPYYSNKKTTISISFYFIYLFLSWIIYTCLHKMHWIFHLKQS